MLWATFSASRSRRKASEFRTSNIFVIFLTSIQRDVNLRRGLRSAKRRFPSAVCRVQGGGTCRVSAGPVVRYLCPEEGRVFAEGAALLRPLRCLFGVTAPRDRGTCRRPIVWSGVVLRGSGMAGAGHEPGGDEGAQHRPDVGGGLVEG